MTRWLTRRLIVSVITMIGFSVLVFVLIRMAPSDPVDLMLSRQRTGGLVGEALLRYKAQLRADLGLDQPLPLQYLYWVREILLHGNFGYSIMSDQPAADFLLQRLPATLLLMTCSLLFAFVVGIPLGIVSAVYRGRPLDGVVSAASLAVVAIPTFFLGLTLLYVFAANLHWLPSGGLATPGSDPDVVDIGRHLVLPVVVLGGASAGVVARYVRASILDTLGREYLMTARSKGLSGRVVLIRHALPNALLPVITLVGLSIGALAAGAFVVEQLFAWPGMGRIALKAITDRDYPVIQAFALLTGFMVLLGSLVADVGYAIADPRIRLE